MTEEQQPTDVHLVYVSEHYVTNICYWKLNKQLPKTNYITGTFLFSFKTLLVVQQFISCLLSRENYVVNVNITCVNK